MLSTVRSTKIVNVMSPREGVLVLGHGHIGLIVKMQEGLGNGLLRNGKRTKGTIYNFYVISIYSTMIGYNVAFLFCIL